MLLPENMLKRLMAHDVLSQSLPGLPLAELAGDKRVLIENHQGVTEYGEERICVKVAFGILSVSGRELTLNSMSKQQLIICGSIDRLELDREEGEKRER